MAGGDWRGLELATVGCIWLELIVTKAITEPYSGVLDNCKENETVAVQLKDFFNMLNVETKLFIKDRKKIFLTGIFSI